MGKKKKKKRTTFQVVLNLLTKLTISLDSGLRWGLARLTDKLTATNRNTARHILTENIQVEKKNNNFEIFYLHGFRFSH